MDPTYTTTDPSGLFVTTSGLALDAWAPTTLAPILYDPATMSTPWIDGNGVQVAMQSDGTIVPVAIGSANIGPLPAVQVPGGVTDLLATGVQSAGTWLQRLLNPSAVPTAYAPGAAPVSALGNPMTLLLLGVGAYFLLRKR